jgi:transcriptional regulator with PAS, ATPase and Fis domain
MLTLVLTQRDLSPLLSQIKASDRQFVALSPLELESFKVTEPIGELWIDVDAFAQNEALNQKTLDLWRQTLQRFLASCAHADTGLVPQMVGLCEEAHFARAQLACSLGARKILSHQQVLQNLQAATLVKFDEWAQASMQLAKPAVLSKAQPMSAQIIPFPVPSLNGASLALNTLRDLVRKVAPTDSSVLLVGPTGTGKDRVARAIHEASPRASHPFVTISCGSLNANTFEAEFFGHEQGAFTGAERRNGGLLLSAHGGTVFLDDIGHLSLELQSKILRVIQDRTFYPVGSEKLSTVDVRWMASNQDPLEDLVEQKTFREDLFYRIKVVEIQIPSLRERRGDLPELSEGILKALARKNKKPLLQIANQVFEKLMLYAWPGNVRELENVIEQACVMAWGDGRAVIDLADLPPHLLVSEMTLKSELSLKEAVRRFEREHILQTIRRVGGSKEEAAEALGLSLASLYRKLA